MNQLRLTQKVQKAAGLKPSDLSEISGDEIAMGSWTVNLFNQDRKKVLIFVNDKTLYSFILTGVRKEHYKNFRESFLLGLHQLLEIDEFSKQQIKYLLSGLNEITYTKTGSKQVLGNMNDLVWHYQYSISSAGGLAYADIGEIIYRLNRMPQKNIGWSYSIDAVKELAKNA